MTLNNLYSPETEQNLIGSLLLDPESIGDIHLKPYQLYSSKLATVLIAIFSVTADGLAADLPAVIDRLKQSGDLDRIGGAYFVSGLMETAVSSASIKQDQARILEYWRKRELFKGLNNITADLEKTDSAETESKILDFLKSLEISDGHGFKNTSLLSSEFLDYFDKQITGKGENLKTKFTELDRLTNGIKPGDFLIIGAGTSQGKTALSLNIARNIAESGQPVGFISLEMPGIQLMQRLALSLSLIHI